jgi:hypothetical protein
MVTSTDLAIGTLTAEVQGTYTLTITGTGDEPPRSIIVMRNDEGQLVDTHGNVLTESETLSQEVIDALEASVPQAPVRVTVRSGESERSYLVRESLPQTFRDAEGHEYSGTRYDVVVDGNIQYTAILNQDTGEVAYYRGEPVDENRISSEDLEGERGIPAQVRAQVERGLEFGGELRRAAAAAGGWISYLQPGETTRLVRSISRWAGYDEDNLGETQATVVEWMQNVFGYMNWADMACRTEISTEEGSSFVSRSGYTSIDIEGEVQEVIPCGDISSGDFTLPNGSSINCAHYYKYKISGEAVPAEVAMSFHVYLNGAGSDVSYDENTDLHLYDGALTELNRSGTRWSLSGANMFTYESYVLFNKACLQFTGESFANLQRVIPALYDDDNPYCNTIKPAYDSQAVGDIDNPASGGGLGPAAPSGAGETGGCVGPAC